VSMKTVRSHQSAKLTHLETGTSSSIATYRVFEDPEATHTKPPWDETDCELTGTAVSKNCLFTLSNNPTRDFDVFELRNRTRRVTASRFASPSNPASNDADDISRNASWSSNCSWSSRSDNCRLARILALCIRQRTSIGVGLDVRI